MIIVDRNKLIEVLSMYKNKLSPFLKMQNSFLVLTSEQKKTIILTNNCSQTVQQYAVSKDYDFNYFVLVVQKYVENFFKSNPDNIADYIFLCENMLREYNSLSFDFGKKISVPLSKITKDVKKFIQEHSIETENPLDGFDKCGTYLLHKLSKNDKHILLSSCTSVILGMKPKCTNNILTKDNNNDQARLLYKSIPKNKEILKTKLKLCNTSIIFDTKQATIFKKGQILQRSYFIGKKPSNLPLRGIPCLLIKFKQNKIVEDCKLVLNHKKELALSDYLDGMLSDYIDCIKQKGVKIIVTCDNCPKTYVDSINKEDIFILTMEKSDFKSICDSVGAYSLFDFYGISNSKPTLIEKLAFYNSERFLLLRNDHNRDYISGIINCDNEIHKQYLKENFERLLIYWRSFIETEFKLFDPAKLFLLQYENPEDLLLRKFKQMVYDTIFNHFCSKDYNKIMGLPTTDSIVKTIESVLELLQLFASTEFMKIRKIEKALNKTTSNSD